MIKIVKNKTIIKKVAAIGLSLAITLGNIAPVLAKEDRDSSSQEPTTYILKEDNTFVNRLLNRSIEYNKTDIKNKNVSVFTITGGKDKPIPLKEFLNWEEKYEYAVLSREESVKIVTDEEDNHYVEANPFNPSLEPVVLLLDNDKRIAIRYDDKYFKRNKFKGYEDDPFYNGYKKENYPLSKFAYVDSSGVEVIPVGDFSNIDEFNDYFNTPYKNESLIDKILISLNLKESTNIRPIESLKQIEETPIKEFKSVDDLKIEKTKPKSLLTDTKIKKESNRDKEGEKLNSQDKNVSEKEIKKEELNRSSNVEVEEIKENSKEIKNEHGESIKDINGNYDIKKIKPITNSIQGVVEAFGLTDPVQFELLSERQLKGLMVGLTDNELEIIYTNLSKYGIPNKELVKNEIIKRLQGKSKEELKDSIKDDGAGESVKSKNENNNLAPNGPNDGADSISEIEFPDNNQKDTPTNTGNTGITKPDNNPIVGDENDKPLWNIGDYSGQEDLEMGGEGEVPEGGVSWDDFDSGDWDKQIETQGGSCYDLNLSTSEMNKCLINGYSAYIQGLEEKNSQHKDIATGGTYQEMETSQKKEIKRRVMDGIANKYTADQIRNMSDEEFEEIIRGSGLSKEDAIKQIGGGTLAGGTGPITKDDIIGGNTGKFNEEQNHNINPGKLNNPYNEVYDESPLLVDSEGTEDDLLDTAYSDMEYGLYDENFNLLEADAWSFEPPERKEIKFITYEVEEKKDYQLLTYSIFLVLLVTITILVYIGASRIQEEAKREEFKSSLRFEPDEINFVDILDKDIIGGDF